MEFNFSYSNINKSEISFSVKDKIISSFNNKTTKIDREKLPINNIFRINSFLFNEEKQMEEIYK